MTPAISIQNLTKYYRRLKALDNVSFEVAPGEFFGFLGPNGAGKTTTIGVITGLANYSAGSIKVFGDDVRSQYRQARSRIGLVPQEFNFDPFLSAEQILTFEGGYFGMPASEARKRARELLEFFEIWEKRSQGYKKLSGGMKRRLLIARALMHRPSVLILDEPTAGVDIDLRYQLWDFLKKLNRDGTTIFLTTHYIEEAERLCSRICVIHQGRIVAQAPTDQLVRKMNLAEVELFLKEPVRVEPGMWGEVEVSVEDEGLRLRFEDREKALSSVLRTVHDRQLDVERINVRRPTLEDAFLKLTGRRQEKA